MEEETSDVAAWLDKSIVKLAARFGQYTQNHPHSLQLPASFAMLPQWFYNLRRSPFMQVRMQTVITYVQADPTFQLD